MILICYSLFLSIVVCLVYLLLFIICSSFIFHLFFYRLFPHLRLSLLPFSLTFDVSFSPFPSHSVIIIISLSFWFTFRLQLSLLLLYLAFLWYLIISLNLFTPYSLFSPCILLCTPGAFLKKSHLAYCIFFPSLALSASRPSFQISFLFQNISPSTTSVNIFIIIIFLSLLLCLSFASRPSLSRFVRTRGFSLRMCLKPCIQWQLSWE